MLKPIAAAFVAPLTLFGYASMADTEQRKQNAHRQGYRAGQSQSR